MSKTVEALDAMGGRLINQVFGYATSGKLWITLGAMYVGYTQGGLEGAIMAVAAGGIFVSAKAYQNGKIIQAETNKEIVRSGIPAAVPAPKPAPAAQIVVPPIGTQYYDPVDPKLFGSDAAGAFLRWEEFEDVFTKINFNDYTPSVRYPYAQQLTQEAWARLEAAWAEAFVDAGADEVPPVPGLGDFTGHRLTEKAEKQLEKLLPSICGRLSGKVYNIRRLSIAISQFYRMNDNLQQLEGLDIDWTKARNLEAIERRGLGVVSNKAHL